MLRSTTNRRFTESYPSRSGVAMNLAEDISARILELRQQGSGLASLEHSISSWSQTRFWNLKRDLQVPRLSDALASNVRFQSDLAEAIHWEKPSCDSPELTLLAVDAARGGIPPPSAAVFGKDLDWELWKRKPDLHQLQLLFEDNAPVRNAFARAVGAFPGRRHIQEIAAEAIAEIHESKPAAASIRRVLETHFLNWRSFQEGKQDMELLAALKEDFTFRDEVARAIGFRNNEAMDLAMFAMDMWKAASHGLSREDTRDSLLDQLRSSEHGKEVASILRASASRNPQGDWSDIQSQLSVTFAQEPMSACVLWDVMEWPRPFSLVLREEMKQIEESRRLKRTDGEPAEPSLAATALDASDLAVHKKLFAVAFSGGGIRSATFNLGVLQKLSDIGLLARVDYLSTVSGGGYIGSWLAGWICKNGAQSFQSFVPKLKALLSPSCPDPRATAQKPIRFLREFSNYLTPRLGDFGFDTWTMGAVYSRNVVLNQAVLITFLGTMLLVPRLLQAPMMLSGADQWMWMVAALALLFAVTCMSLNMRKAVEDSLGKPGPLALWLEARLPKALYHPHYIVLLVVGNILVAVYFGSVWMWRHIPEVADNERTILTAAFGFAAILSLLLSGLGGFVHKFRIRQSGANLWPVVLAMITLLSAMTSVGLFHVFTSVLLFLYHSNWAVWHAEVWGPVLLLAVLVVPGTLQVGLMGVDYPDAGREWLSRFRAVCSIFSLYWVMLMSATIYGPFLVLKVMRWSAHGYKAWISGLTLGWVITTVAGLVAGRSNETGRSKDGTPSFSWVQVLAKLGPPVFIVGLVLLLATLEELLLAHGEQKPLSLDFLTQQHFCLLRPWPMWGTDGVYVDRIGWLLVCLGAASAILAWRVDINEFSMHHFYKNRLVRCYLGASNEKRQPNQFTGFDESDDFHLSRLTPIIPAHPRGVDAAKKRTPYMGPYPIVNATLNLSVGKQLAWQERKGASFIFTPCFSGFDAQSWMGSPDSTSGYAMTRKGGFWNRETIHPLGYRKTETYTQAGGPQLGTAMSISGAAANPNQGYNTSPAVSFLMTMFNVRLGWWLGNPRRDRSSKLSSPRFGLAALLSELIGSTDDETRFVNLSDGGHFDNMGLYELVRRRCSFILLCDAEQDPEYKFEGLGAAIRKCRVDFGAFIEIDPARIKPSSSGKTSDSHCAVGRIQYLDGSEGVLVYIKASLTGDEPEDVAQYQATQDQFPHETTADQWFAESQFESYRALGYHATHHALTPATEWLSWDTQHPDIEKFFLAMKDYWYPVNPRLKDAGSKHTGTLSEIFDRLRKDPVLQGLGAELFPGAFASTSTLRRDPVAEFYFSMSIIQLMEDLYLDFQLDHFKWLRDPRIGGWKHLFQRWKTVPAVAGAWAAERDAFRKDFQLFWNSL